MTVGVPYSFVPGTKAKADEVNANFIHILTKIEDTNTRINETNSNSETTKSEILEKFTQTEEKIENCADLDLSNLSDTGKEILANKANVADIDGNWIWNQATLVTGFTLYNSAISSFSLYDYLPKDGNLYEVLFDLTGEASNYGYFYLSNDMTSFLCVRAKGTHFANTFTLPIGSTRAVRFSPYSTNVSGNTVVYLYARGYRKVR